MAHTHLANELKEKKTKKQNKMQIRSIITYIDRYLLVKEMI